MREGCRRPRTRAAQTGWSSSKTTQAGAAALEGRCSPRPGGDVADASPLPGRQPSRPDRRPRTPCPRRRIARCPLTTVVTSIAAGRDVGRRRPTITRSSVRPLHQVLHSFEGGPRRSTARGRSTARPRRRASGATVSQQEINDDTKKTMSKIALPAGTPAVAGIVARMMGTAPRSPAHDSRACSRQSRRNGRSETTTAVGRATRTRMAATTRPGTATRGNSAGETSRPRIRKRTGRCRRRGSNRSCG